MKSLKKKSNTNVSAFAISKYVRTSPVKVRRILEQLIGRPAHEARFLLQFMPNRACQYISNVLKAAIAHAKFKYGETSYSFFISRGIVNEGTSLKRFQPRSQGRAFPIKKRFSHILIFSEIIRY
jgi:large subunit ribosomal protein L22